MNIIFYHFTTQQLIDCDKDNSHTRYIQISHGSRLVILCLFCFLFKRF